MKTQGSLSLRRPNNHNIPEIVPAPQQEPPAGGEKPTLPLLVEAFLADAKTRVKADTLRTYTTCLGSFAGAFAATSPDRLTAAQVESWSMNPGWSQSYRCGIIGTVMSLFKWAVERGRLDRNPVAGIKKPEKQSRGRGAVISPADHAKLVRHAAGDFGLFLQLLWLTGARPGEIAGLAAADVDLANKVAVLRRHGAAGRAGKGRLLVLTEEAVEALVELTRRRPEGLLFPGEDGGKMTARAIASRLARVCERAGVKGCVASGYRHTFAAHALSQGVPASDVAALLGYSGTAMLHMHYPHLRGSANGLREAAGKVRARKGPRQGRRPVSGVREAGSAKVADDAQPRPLQGCAIPL
jgi:integrase